MKGNSYQEPVRKAQHYTKLKKRQKWIMMISKKKNYDKSYEMNSHTISLTDPIPS